MKKPLVLKTESNPGPPKHQNNGLYVLCRLLFGVLWRSRIILASIYPLSFWDVKGSLSPLLTPGVIQYFAANHDL